MAGSPMWVGDFDAVDFLNHWHDSLAT